MADVVSLAEVRADRERKLTAAQEDAFAEYLALRNRVEETGALADGMAAGRAWGNFIALFVRPL